MKLKLIILQGLPCSGKSTWVKEFLSSGICVNDWKVINRDEIRYQIGNGKYTMDHEPEVTELQNAMYENAAESGLNIISDNTNLNNKYNKDLEKWADEHGYEVEYKEFYVPYAEAMKRSKARKEAGGLYIPKDVMKRFYIRYYEDEFRKEMTDPKIEEVSRCIRDGIGKPSAVIVDLDGTLALHNGREPFEWDRLPMDVADWRLQMILYSLAPDNEIIFLTGRPNSVREATEQWLQEHFISRYNSWYGEDLNYQLFMRDVKDFSHGDDYKRKVYLENIKGNYKILGVFEDSQKCINMWRKEGLLCFAVANNDY